MEFRAAFHMGANALTTDDRHLNIFEKTLQIPGNKDFIRECLNSGCSPNHVSLWKYRKYKIFFKDFVVLG